MTKPFMKKLTPKEREEIVDKAVEALDRGDEDEYDRYCCMLPLAPESANALKQSVGLEALIARGINLIEAVEAYGEDWLSN